MNWTKQACTLAVASAVGLGAVSAGPALAQPAPYTLKATTTVSTTNPPRGGNVKMTGANWAGGETVVIRIRSKAKTLAKVTANPRGKWRTTITLPKKYRCQHTLVVRGKRSDYVTRTPIVIGKASRCRKL
ncbi:hypothetical protein [Sporichthya sp.]|uniref:hypothetical protein n=1 Tax=Sporichthya sp. TaxID=65475 RepID=UPI0017C98DB4|nr:hypothetical protein [Sporichthya sp.]MBA3741953.1 hypothetical protein [Sporichthya sp.]